MTESWLLVVAYDHHCTTDSVVPYFDSKETFKSINQICAVATDSCRCLDELKNARNSNISVCNLTKRDLILIGTFVSIFSIVFQSDILSSKNHYSYVNRSVNTVLTDYQIII